MIKTKIFFCPNEKRKFCFKNKVITQYGFHSEGGYIGYVTFKIKRKRK